MKITKSQLKQIIKEELSKVLREADDTSAGTHLDAEVSHELSDLFLKRFGASSHEEVKAMFRDDRKQAEKREKKAILKPEELKKLVAQYVPSRIRTAEDFLHLAWEQSLLPDSNDPKHGQIHQAPPQPEEYCIKIDKGTSR